MRKKHLLIATLALVGLVFMGCNVDIPTYNVTVSGTVVDTKGTPVIGASVKVIDRQKDTNAMFGNASNAYVDRIVGTTTTDETGHYAISISTEGFLFDVSAVRKELNWESSFAQSGSARCECTSGKSEYMQDIVAKTEIEHYIGSTWMDAVEATPLAVSLSDSIHIRLKDGGTIQSAGIWFDYPYETQEGGTSVMCHSYKSDYNMYYCVDGGDYRMPAGLTEYDLIFKMDTTSETVCTIPYCERCYLKVASIKNNKDEDSYFIPLTISSK